MIRHCSLLYSLTVESRYCLSYSKARKCITYDQLETITILLLSWEMLEKCIRKRLVNYFEDNNLISEKQYGFQAHEPTMQAVMKLTKYLIEKRDKGVVLGCLFIALQKHLIWLPMKY